MRTTKIETLPEQPKAEGVCMGLPYDTQLVSADGVNVHFWVKDDAAKAALPTALAAARQHQDIVGCTWCEGEQSGFWAHSNIPEAT